MCLTEAHSGTDLGILKTRAEPQADGSYARHRHQDLHQRGRTRPDVEHRPPRAGAPARRAGRHARHQPVPRAEIPARRATATPGKAERRQLRLDRAQDGHPRVAHLRHALQRLDRLAGRQAERRPRLHVHDDEPRAARRRAAGPRSFGARLAGVDRLRERPPAGPRDDGPEGAGQARRPDHRAPRRAAHAAHAEGVRRRRSRALLPDGARDRQRAPESRTRPRAGARTT